MRPKLGDAAHLPWPDGSFDAALSANMFFFVDEPEQAIAECARVLVPDGRLVIATVPGPLPEPSLSRWWVYPPIGTALRVHTDRAMAAMLSAAGFTDVSVERPAEALQLVSGVRGREPAES